MFDAADSNLGGIDCGYTLSLTAIQGNDQTIKLDTDIKAYAVKITDNKGGSANTVEFENVDNYKYRTAFDKVKGVGLINCSTYALTVDSLKLPARSALRRITTTENRMLMKTFLQVVLLAEYRVLASLAE